ncbi:hypothetical protein N9L68_00585 [bacterium]|nr:hypothetical protein [bacterium]
MTQDVAVMPHPPRPRGPMIFRFELDLALRVLVDRKTKVVYVDEETPPVGFARCQAAERDDFSRPPDIMIPAVHFFLRDFFACQDGAAQQVSSKQTEVLMFDDAALVAFRMVPRRIQELLDDDLERLLGQDVFCPRQESCGRRRSTSESGHRHVHARGSATSGTKVEGRMHTTTLLRPRHV